MRRSNRMSALPAGGTPSHGAFTTGFCWPGVVPGVLALLLLAIPAAGERPPGPPAGAAGAAEAGEAAVPPVPLLKVLVPRETFPELIREEGSGHRLLPLVELETILDEHRRRAIGAWNRARAREEDRAREQTHLEVDRVSFEIRVLADQGSARVTVACDLRVLSGDGARLEIPLQGVALEGLLVDGEDPVLLPAPGDRVIVRLGGPGPRRLQYVLAAPVEIHDYSRRLGIEVVAFPTGDLVAHLPDTSLVASLDQGVRIESAEEAGSTRIRSQMTAGSRIDLEWYRQAHPTPAPRREAQAREPAALSPGSPDAGKPKTPATPARAPFVEVEVGHRVGVAASKLHGTVALRYEVQRSPISRVVVACPGSVDPVRIESGDELVASMTRRGDELVFELRAPRAEPFSLGLSYQMGYKATGEATLPVPEFEPRGVQSEVGYVVVDRRDNVLVTGRPGPGMEPLQVDLIPVHTRGLCGDDTLLTYRYLAHPASLELAVRSFPDAPVLTAVVIRQVATTLFGPGGGSLTLAQLDLLNRGHDFLDLEMPEGARLERITLDGTRVSPGRDETSGRLLIPVGTEASGAERVNRILVEYRSDPPAGARISARLPVFGLPVLEVAWRWLIPSDRSLLDFDGPVSLALAPSRDYPDPVATVHDFSAYHLSQSMVPAGGAVEASARTLSGLSRLLPMLFSFLLGVALVVLLLGMMFRGRYPRLTVTMITAAWLLGSLVVRESELIRPPLSGGFVFASWAVILLAIPAAIVACARRMRRMVEPLSFPIDLGVEPEDLDDPDPAGTHPDPGAGPTTNSAESQPSDPRSRPAADRPPAPPPGPVSPEAHVFDVPTDPGRKPGEGGSDDGPH